MSLSARPFLLVGESALHVPQQRVQAALDAWLELWSRTGEPLCMSVHALGECAKCGLAEAHYQEIAGVRARVWVRREQGLSSGLGRVALGQALLDELGNSGTWAGDVGEAAREACQRMLCEALTGAPCAQEFTWRDSPAASLFAPGSGAVHIHCDALGLHLLADAGVWRDTVPPRARQPRALVGLKHAVRDSTARLEARLGEVDMELSKITDLRRGDVLRLPQPLDRGIRVLCEEELLASGALGEMLGQKCVQLTN
jgi:Type III flagellar switch regulator (C-ring) FliN C-term